ncbi:GntR family transcriptional regulator [Paraglaciecola hydrolytica]|uniref:GntR family transcriptional regulator n=1 Tax=Paraglaciecola hydrolytica TaxID=1799789 RepID=A0A148KME7_9ALTE|nr:GntR family transcriptional regulator [Paraglaciecola hydrolytica]KXI27451.1 GntR family transcriptional regulator [Paraglaciecola hydrolytica]
MQDKPMAQSLYEQLKQDIRDNKLPVAMALKQEELAAQYGVSRIPIRDVLQKLKNEGWLVQSGKCGVMIASLSAQEAEDLSLMRQYLEPLILAYALPNLTNNILGHAEDLLVALDNKHLSVTECGELNWQFHACLYQAANRPTLFNTIVSLHQQCSRYIGFHNTQLNYNSTSQGEHYQLLDALKNKQLELAQSILKQHIAQASCQLVSYLQAENKP